MQIAHINDNGLKAKEYILRVGARLPDGQLVFGNSNGLLSFRTSDIIGGSAIEFRLFDSGYWDSAASVFCHRVMADEMEFEFQLGTNELYKENDEPLNLSHVTIACFWCFAPCTIFIDEIYLEKTLAAGEMEYYATPFDMTDRGVNYKSDDIFVDETNWTLPIYGVESFAGWQWNTPQDWSAYRYLVVVPQVPFASTSPVGTKPFQFNLSDGTYKFSNAELRHFFYNRQRAMVVDSLSRTTLPTNTPPSAFPSMQPFAKQRPTL